MPEIALLFYPPWQLWDSSLSWDSKCFTEWRNHKGLWSKAGWLLSHPHWPSELAHERRPLVGQLGPVVAAASTAGRDRKWATHSLGEKKLETIKILKMGLGDSRPLGSRALFLGAISLFVSVVLRWNQPTVSPVTSPILLITSNYLYFRVQELSPSWRS